MTRRKTQPQAGGGYYFLLIPKDHKDGFTQPKFVFGDTVQNPASGLYGTVISMTFYPTDLNPDWEPGWRYELRLNRASCSPDAYFAREGVEVFKESELRLRPQPQS